jgi:hypothetical protein
MMLPRVRHSSMAFCASNTTDGRPTVSMKVLWTSVWLLEMGRSVEY